MLPPDPRHFKDIYVVFELLESDLHTVIGANDDLTQVRSLRLKAWTLRDTISLDLCGRPSYLYHVSVLALHSLSTWPYTRTRTSPLPHTHFYTRVVQIIWH